MYFLLMKRQQNKLRLNIAVHHIPAKSKEAKTCAGSNFGQGSRTVKTQSGDTNIARSFKVTKTGAKVQICPRSGEAKVLSKTIL